MPEVPQPKGPFWSSRDWRHRRIAFEIVRDHLRDILEADDALIQRFIEKVKMRNPDLSKALAEQIRLTRAAKK